MVSLVAQRLKCLPGMQETRVRSLGWEDPLEWVAISYLLFFFRASLVVQMVKNPPAMQETWARSLGWEDPLEEGMGTHSRGSSQPRDQTQVSCIARRFFTG